MKNRTIVTRIKINSSKLQFDIPLNWSINKLKCLITTQVPALSFDQFELSHHSKLLRGNFVLKDILEEQQNTVGIELAVVKVESHVKFAQYYQKCMTNFIHPILTPQYQKYNTLASNPLNPTNPHNPNPNLDQQQQEMNMQGLQNQGNGIANPFLRMLRLIGFYLVLVLIWDYGKLHQILIIGFIVLFYFAIQFVVKYKQRKINKGRNLARTGNRRIRVGEEEVGGGQESRVKGLIKLYFYKGLEIVFCFLLTFFPNLSIDMHLQLNRQKIQRARQQINRLIPNSYQIAEQINQGNQNANANINQR